MNGRHPLVRIAPVDGDSSRFVASFKAEVLGATYAVVFPETVTGAIALHRFVQMIEQQYGKQVEIQLADELLPFHSEAVADLLHSLGITESEKLQTVR
jgi:hypothetical protein